MRDFKLDMKVYDYKNDKHEIYGKFSKLKKDQLCFIQDLSISHYFDEDKYMFGWYDTRQSTSHDICLENATASDIEYVIKECFEYYDMRYDYIKVELL